MRRYGNEYCAKVMTGTSYGINKYVVVKKNWESKNMLFPIPTSARDHNPLLEQTPGNKTPSINFIDQLQEIIYISEGGH